MNRFENNIFRLAIICAIATGSVVLTMAADRVVVIPLSGSSKVAALEARVASLETLLAGVTRNGSDISFNGVNVHILDGSGDTSGPVNGLGNLIIGYNEERGIGDVRSGSHNLVLGGKNNYSSYGGLVTGFHNTISAGYATVSGGGSNTASGMYSSVSGGGFNRALDKYSSVSGGSTNIASSQYTSVSGGQNNTASNWYSSVSGGASRSVSGMFDWRAGTLFETN